MAHSRMAEMESAPCVSELPQYWAVASTSAFGKSPGLLGSALHRNVKTTLLSSAAMPARMKIGMMVAKPSRRLRRCTWLPTLAETSANLSRKLCPLAMSFTPN